MDIWIFISHYKLADAFLKFQVTQIQNPLPQT